MLQLPEQLGYGIIYVIRGLIKRGRGAIKT